jgi:hypothetical protein
MPLDDVGEILLQDVRVKVRTGHGIDVEDRLRVRVKRGRFDRNVTASKERGAIRQIG